MFFTKKAKKQINDNFVELFKRIELHDKRLKRIEDLLIRRGYSADIRIEDDKR